MSAAQIHFSVDADDRIRLDPPRMAVGISGAEFEVPWHLTISGGDAMVALSVSSAAKLVELRDAITAALDAHGDQS